MLKTVNSDKIQTKYLNKKKKSSPSKVGTNKIKFMTYKEKEHNFWMKSITEKSISKNKK